MNDATPRPIPELIQEAQARQAAGDWAGAARLYRQVLRRRPDHAGAWLARIECTLQMGRPWRALRLCRAALPRLPGHRVTIETRRARALEARGRSAEALALLADLRTEAPDDLPAVAVQAGMLQRAGRLEEADAAWQRVLELRPDHAGAWLARVGLAQTRDAPAEALALIEAAAPHCPDQARELDLRRVRALDALGRSAEALALAGALCAEAPEDLPARLLRAELARKTGDLAGAAADYERVLARDPDHLGAWQGRIEAAQGAGDIDRALALCAEALAHRPGEAALIARQAGLMLLAGQTARARDTLAPALEAAPQDLRLRLAMARATLQAGGAEAAQAQFAACVEAAPENRTALLGLADAAEACGDPAAGLAALRPQAARHPALGLRTAELALRAGRRDDLQTHLDALAATARESSEDGLLRLFKLAEQGDHAGAALAVLDAVKARAEITPPLAQFLLRRARVLVPPEVAAGVRDALERRLPAADRPGFRAFAAGFFDPPARALARARAELRGTGGPKVAEQLGEMLLHAGQGALAVRYLGLCLRRWPNARSLRAQFMRVAIYSGHLAAARTLLDRLGRRCPELDLGPDRVVLMIRQGELKEAMAEVEARAGAGLKTLALRDFLDLVLALGDLETANRLARQLLGEPGAGRKTAAHFSLTQRGAKLNELRIYAASRDQAVAAGEAPGAVRARLAQDFFYPSREIVESRADRLGPRDGPVSVPRRIFQYWHDPQPPEEVAAVMQSWRGAAGFEHALYDRARAMIFLREAFGPRHARAFRMARTPAEECDFLRLCLLYRHGGIYADADDMLTGDASALIAEGPGLIVMREPLGAIANNMICAPPRHPLLLWALRAAGRSLLARENENTWLKTGPGLMTRAVATWLEQVPPEEAARGLTVLAPGDLAPHVQPHVRLSYKTSGHYWNAGDARAPQPLIAALSALGAPPDRT